MHIPENNSQNSSESDQERSFAEKNGQQECPEKGSLQEEGNLQEACSHEDQRHEAKGSEKRRLEVLRRYDVLGNGPVESLDRITRLAADHFEVPASVVNFIGAERQWFKSTVGLEELGIEVRETSLEASFCLHVIESGETTVVQDALNDERFEENPFVTGEPGIRFYAGAPLVSPDGYHIGTLCVLDRKPRDPSAKKIDRLEDLAQITVSELELQRKAEEHRQAEARLRQHRNLLEQTQRLAGAWEADLRSGTTSWSEEIYHIHELPFGTEIGVEEAIRFYAPEARPKIREALRRCAQEGEPYDLELPLITAKGNRRWIRAVGAPSKEEDGEVVKVAGALQDISQRKRAQEALQEREERLRGLANSIPGIVYQFYARSSSSKSSSSRGNSSQDEGSHGSRSYGLYFVSEQAEELLGISAEPEGFFDRFTERVPSSHREEFLESIDEVVEEEKPWRFEMPFEKPSGEKSSGENSSGERIWLLGTSTPERREGELVYNGVILDITDRKEAEKALREQRDRFAILYENLPTAVVHGWADEEGKVHIREVNRAFEEIFGVEGAEVEGEDLDSLLASKEHREESRRLSRVALEEGGLEAEVRRKAAGGLRDFQVQVALREEAEPTEGFAIYTDITARKERERKLKEAKEEAEQASRLKSTFLANMSHEIRTPLTSIIGFAEATSDEVRELKRRYPEIDMGPLGRFASLIEESGTRLLETLNSVLNLSKLEAGEMKLSPQRVDLAEEAPEVATFFEREAEKAGIDLQVDLQAKGDRVWARADVGGLRIVLRNLVSNAIKYTKEGGQVLVRVKEEEGAPVLEVEDTGIGMDPEEVPKLFRAFQQGSEGPGREYEGTGLGLAVTKKVVDQMGGSIEVETEKGEGTQFTVRLPQMRDVNGREEDR